MRIWRISWYSLKEQIRHLLWFETKEAAQHALKSHSTDDELELELINVPIESRRDLVRWLNSYITGGHYDEGKVHHHVSEGAGHTHGDVSDNPKGKGPDSDRRRSH
jgi:hypothetical protein